MRPGLIFLNSLCHRSRNDEEILDWISLRRSSIQCKIHQKPLEELTDWSIKDQEISHKTGKFFQIRFIKSQINGIEWDQPIINQPEIGILGFITKKINGILYFLVQAKIEPGNINTVQLSPTVQSTKSNFTRIHGGNSTPFIEYFLDQKSKILVDQLQSEQSARFYKKRNRNIIIETQDDIIHENYIWLTLGDIVGMTKYDNTINMDTRTVISCIHFGSYNIENYTSLLKENSDIKDNPWLLSLLSRDIYDKTYSEILSKITEFKFKREFKEEFISLSKSKDWILKDGKIQNRKNKFFEIIGVEVSIENREKSSWNQPMIKPLHPGICCFFVKKIRGAYHFLVQLKDEIGIFDGIEMAPTIQTSIENVEKIPYFRIFDKLKETDKVIFNTLQSEEGGRFFQEQNRNIIIDVSGEELEERDEFLWMTLNQLKTFLQFNNYVNIQTRSILASLPL